MSLPAGLKPPRAILFDWDNTLVNTWPTIVECYQDTFTALGMTPWTATEVQDRAHGSLREVFPTLFGARAGEAEKVFYDTFLRIHLERLEPLDGAADLLTHCQRLSSEDRAGRSSTPCCALTWPASFAHHPSG